MQNEIPRHPSGNPSLPAGIYPVVIRQLVHGEYAGHGHYIRIVLWMPEEMTHFVSNLYLPGEYSRKAHERLGMFCRSVGLLPGHLLDKPKNKFVGRWLRIKIRRYLSQNGLEERQYSDVELFLPTVDDAELNREFGMPMIPHSGPQG